MKAGFTKLFFLAGFLFPLLGKSQVLLQEWPMTLSNADSAAVRATGVQASTPTLNNLYVSNGTTNTNIPAYSPTYGQSFGASSAGDGIWGSSSGGPGGNLNRNFYEQFTITGASGYSVRVDSVILYASFYNTSSSTKMGVVYSLTGFASDSADVSGGIGPSGTLAGSANGAFATPIALTNETSGTLAQYHLYLGTGSGVTIPAGQTLTIRVYMCCSSSSAGRYGKIRDVQVKGAVTSTAATPAITATGTPLSAFSQTIGAASAQQAFVASGANLTANVTITIPSPYEVSADSGVTWHNSTSPITLTQSSGNVAAISLKVRLNATAAGTYSDTIRLASTGATTVKIPVTGTAVAAPAITVTGTPLSAFSQTVGTGSAQQAFVASGANLTANITVTIPSPYEVSADSGVTWHNSTSPITLTQSSGNVAAISLKVRLNASAAGTYTDTVRLASTGAATIKVAVTGTTVLAPGITVTGTPLSAFSQTIGTASAQQAMVASGSNLTANVTITIPSPYEVSADSGATWHNSTSPITLTQSSGNVAAISLKVRLNATTAGTYSDTIRLASTGATTVKVPVTGTAIAAPAITVTGTPLGAFSQTIGTASAQHAFVASGSNLTANITVTIPAPYEVSADSGVTWHNSTSPITLTQSSGNVAAISLKVRLNATTAGTYSDTIRLAGTGATTVKIPVTGTAVAAPAITVTGTPLSAFSQTIGTPSVQQAFVASGANLTANVTITIPAPYEVSADSGVTWHNSTSPITLTQSSGNVAAISLKVRLNATTAGTYSDTIRLASTGAATVKIPVTGTAVAAPAITTTGTLSTFSQTVGTPSAAQSFVLSGTALTAGVTVTSPPSFEISTDGGTTWTGTATLTPVSGAVNVTVEVRLNASAAGNYSDSITITSTGADTVKLGVSGTTVTTGVVQVNGGGVLSVYPNPATVNIIIKHTEVPGASISVFDATGRAMVCPYTVLNTGSMVATVAALPTGVYTLVLTGEGQQYTTRFIKQ
ncbi:T9SS type A sorting domain-containing protein [Chitinophagaceae bacterium MMS25-I14]